MLSDGSSVCVYVDMVLDRRSMGKSLLRSVVKDW